MSGCNFPQHHTPEHHGGGGAWWPLAAAVAAAALFAPVITALIHVLAMVLVFTAMAAAAVGVGVLIGRRRARQIHPQPWRPGLPPAQAQPIEQGGQHIHFHGVSAADVAQAMRELGHRGR